MVRHDARVWTQQQEHNERELMDAEEFRGWVVHLEDQQRQRDQLQAQVHAWLVQGSRPAPALDVPVLHQRFAETTAAVEIAQAATMTALRTGRRLRPPPRFVNVSSSTPTPVHSIYDAETASESELPQPKGWQGRRGRRVPKRPLQSLWKERGESRDGDSDAESIRPAERVVHDLSQWECVEFKPISEDGDTDEDDDGEHRPSVLHYVFVRR